MKWNWIMMYKIVWIDFLSEAAFQIIVMRLNTLYECWNIHGFDSFWWWRRRFSENPYSTSVKRFMYSIHGDACIIDLVHCDAEDCTNSLHEFKRFIGSIHCDPGDCLNSFHECRNIHWFNLLWYRRLCESVSRVPKASLIRFIVFLEIDWIHCCVRLPSFIARVPRRLEVLSSRVSSERLSIMVKYQQIV